MYEGMKGDSSGSYTVVPWGIHRKSFTVAVIESNVTSIGNLAFYVAPTKRTYM